MNFQNYILENDLGITLPDHVISTRYLNQERRTRLEQPKTGKWDADASELNTHIKEKNFSKIIENKKLFFAAIIKAYPLKKQPSVSSLELHESNFIVIESSTDFFKIYTHGNSFTNLFIIQIEKIRNFFLEGLKNKKNFNIYCTQWNAWYVGNNQLQNLEENDNFAIEYLRLGFTELANFCGAECSLTTKETLMPRTFQDNTQVPHEIQVYHFAWQKFFKPKKLSQKLPCAEFFYRDYLNGRGDFIICSQTKTEIKIQSTILRHCASLPFKNMLNHPDTLEAKDKKIHITDFSEETIRAYLDYLYLGGEKFIEKITSHDHPEIDLCDYFKFANKYMDEGFIDCCTNLFGLLCDENDIEMIQELNSGKIANEVQEEVKAEVRVIVSKKGISSYENEHLNVLLEKLKDNKEKKSKEFNEENIIFLESSEDNK